VLAVLLPVPELDGHSVQAAALFANALYVPAGQADTLPPLPVCPASARQSDSALLPVLVPVPVLVGHSVQPTELFASALYDPTGQADTPLSPSPVYPASARQSVEASLPVLPPVPELEGQLVQASALCADVLNVPAPQAETCAPLPVNPASARQSDSAPLPVTVPVPELDGQFVQGAVLVAADLNVPAAHTHVLLPSAGSCMASQQTGVVVTWLESRLFELLPLAFVRVTWNW